ncbi:HBL/NHE enterotoxin family protein [Bacillus wiedmannii]|uniref:HBL/NHE enterotoxin family protein n=1 Tax=Bacillus wiedmannii TaxID=1890302 RepID=UPI000BF236C9|nr:HBL/NHE enterotoxin family protein [Bacillus wiedmannii]PEJ73705.1 hypothetical protein CN685_11095 [Bacillus wiedmannii]
MKKAFTTGCMITTLLASVTCPLSALADSSNLPVVNQEEKKESQSTNLFSSSLQNLGTQSVLLKTYALNVLKQPDVQIPDIPNLSTYQEQTKKHAKDWLDTISPGFIDTNQQMIAFQQQFQNYYAILTQLAKTAGSDEKAKQEFIQGLTTLQNRLSQHENQIQKLDSNLKQFQSNFSADAQNFMDAAAKAQKSLEDKNGEIAQLTTKISTLNTDITTQTGAIVGGAFSTVGGIAAITFGSIVLYTTVSAATAGVAVPVLIPMIGGIVAGTAGVAGGATAIGIASKKLQESQQALKDTVEKLTKSKADAAALSLLTAQMKNFTDTIQNGKNSLEQFDDGWHAMQQNFIDLKNDVNQTNPNSTVLENRLSQIKKAVDAISTQAKQQEKIITNISYDQSPKN